jgi:uncharacterized protein (DUF779 family)
MRVPELPSQILATPQALDLIALLRGKHGEPMCYPRGELIIGDGDVWLGSVGEQPFYISRSQFEYWKHTQLTLDVVPGRGGMFSLEGPEGLRFLIRSRMFTDEEYETLSTAGRV